MPPEVFYCYAPSEPDEGLRAELDKQLALMKNNGLIKTWSKRDILPGQQRKDLMASIGTNSPRLPCWPLGPPPALACRRARISSITQQNVCGLLLHCR